jgi:hypothetical protein
MRSLLPLLLAGVLLVTACKKDEAKPAEPDKASAAAPAATDGARPATAKAAVAPTPSPVTSEFLRLADLNGDQRAVLRFTNASDKPVTRLILSLVYYGADNRELGRHPWSQSGAGVVPPKASAELTLGAALAPGTARVAAQVLEVRFDGGEAWRAGGARVLSPRKTGRPTTFKLNNVEHLRPTTRGDASVQNAPRPQNRATTGALRPAPITSQPLPRQ